MPEIFFGADLKVNDGGTGASSGAQTAMPNITSMTPPHTVDAKTEYTAINGSDKLIRSLPGKRELGTMKVTCFYTDAEYSRWLTLRGVDHNFEFVLNGSKKATFSGFVDEVGVEQGSELDALKLLMVSIKLNSDVTVASV